MVWHQPSLEMSSPLENVQLKEKNVSNLAATKLLLARVMWTKYVELFKKELGFRHIAMASMNFSLMTRE